MSLGLSGLRGVYEVYNTIHDASVRQLASHGGAHNDCDSIIGAIDFLTTQCSISGTLPGSFSERTGSSLHSFLWLV